MPTITTVDIQALIEAAARGAFAGGVGRDRDVRAGGSGYLDERHFRRMDKFDGAEAKWKEWAFQLKTLVGTVNSKTRDLLEEIQKTSKDPNWDELFVEVTQEHIDKMGAELYSLLVSLSSGEALMVVRGVAGGNGWEAWQRLAARFDPRTPAHALRAMMLVLQPGR